MLICTAVIWNDIDMFSKKWRLFIILSDTQQWTIAPFQKLWNTITYRVFSSWNGSFPNVATVYVVVDETADYVYNRATYVLGIFSDYANWTFIYLAMYADTQRVHVILSRHKFYREYKENEVAPHFSQELEQNWNYGGSEKSTNATHTHTKKSVYCIRAMHKSMSACIKCVRIQKIKVASTQRNTSPSYYIANRNLRCFAALELFEEIRRLSNTHFPAQGFDERIVNELIQNVLVRVQTWLSNMLNV